MSLKMYGIPNCGTCKKAMKWLDARNVTYDFINTKEHAPSRQNIEEWVAALGSKPMRNTSGLSYRAIGEEKKTWTDAQWIDAFTEDAMLLRRPLFVKDGGAVLVGFRGTDEKIGQALGVSI